MTKRIDVWICRDKDGTVAMQRAIDGEDPTLCIDGVWRNDHGMLVGDSLQVSSEFIHGMSIRKGRRKRATLVVEV